MGKDMTSLYYYVPFLIFFWTTATAEKFVLPVFSLRYHYINTTYHLIITASSDTEVNVTGFVNSTFIQPIINEHIDSSKVTLLYVTFPFLTGGSKIKNASIVVESKKKISLRVLPMINEHFEGFLAIPVSRLGHEYYVGAFCVLGGYCQITIATVEPGTTQVFIELPSITDREIVYCSNDSFWKSGRDKVMILTYPEVMQITTRQDLSGSYISSDKPLSVLTGTHSYDGDTVTRHFMEHLTPINEWGKEFIFKAVGNDPSGNIINIIASQTETTLEMTGFPTVQLTRGQSLHRRVNKDEMCHIEADRPVQVILFANMSDDTGNHILPAMTLIPSLQHANDYSIAGCKIIRDEPVNKIQITTEYDSSVDMSSSLREGNTTQFPYGLYKVVDLVATSRLRDKYELSSRVTGIVICDRSFIMPLAPPLLNADNSSCSIDYTRMIPGDQIDNDCDGHVDEDYCFEDMTINSSFVSSNSDDSNWLFIDIAGFRVIKLRLASLCTLITMIQLQDNNNATVTLRIDRRTVRAYSNNLAESPDIHLNITGYHKICNSIHPFWLVWDGSHVCFDYGPVPKEDCASTTIRLGLDNPLTTMRIGGLFSYEIYWIDVYREDCGNMYSTWRCTDIYSNCSEYSKDVCSGYFTWAALYCRQYCGMCKLNKAVASLLKVGGYFRCAGRYCRQYYRICSPDSFGRAFVVAFPSSANSATSHNMYIRNQNTSNPISSRGVSLTRSLDQEYLNGNLHEPFTVCNDGHSNYSEFMKLTWNSQIRSNVFLYFDTDVAVYVRDSHQYPGPNEKVYFSINPLDTAGKEFMTSFFEQTIECRIIAHAGFTDIWKMTFESTLFLGSFDGNDIISQMLYGADCTGTIFLGSRPITVFCGGTESHNSWQQLRSTESWGKEYIVRPALHGHFIMAVVRIITNSHNTRVVQQENSSTNRTFLLHRRGSHVDVEVYHNVTYVITSDRPISVGILYRSYTENLVNSAWIVLPAISNYMDMPSILINTRFTAPHLSSILHTADNSLGAQDVHFMAGCFGFVNSNLNASFIMNRGLDEAIFEPFVVSTSNFNRIAKDAVCHVTTGSVGDGIDNDCDGRIDEEITCFTGYGVVQNDADGDGAYTEDCAAVAIGSPVKWFPSLPFCPIDAEYGHWQVCECNCSWVANLDLYKSRSVDAQTIWNQLEANRIKESLTLNASKTSTQEVLGAMEDDRQSSTTIGLVAVITMILTVLFFVFLDLIRLWAYLKVWINTRRH